MNNRVKSSGGHEVKDWMGRGFYNDSGTIRRDPVFKPTNGQGNKKP